MIKVLMIAYACNPEKGSEPGGAWEWIQELSKTNILFVVTRRKNYNIIQKYKHTLINVTFIYFDLPKVILLFKRGEFGTNWYYYLWNLFLTIKLIFSNVHNKVDIAHHLTFGAVWRPSCLALLGIPYLLGPIGGAEKIPFKFYKYMGIKEVLSIS